MMDAQNAIDIILKFVAITVAFIVVLFVVAYTVLAERRVLGFLAQDSDIEHDPIATALNAVDAGDVGAELVGAQGIEVNFVISEVVEGFIQRLGGHGALFGGMSGVGFGLLGYMATKSRFDSRERYLLAPGTTLMAMLWFALCILRDIPPFSEMLSAIPAAANSAHAVGLLVGAAIAYVPLLVRKAA